MSSMDVKESFMGFFIASVGTAEGLTNLVIKYLMTWGWRSKR